MKPLPPIYVVITPLGEPAVSHGRTVLVYDTPVEPPIDCTLEKYVSVSQPMTQPPNTQRLLAAARALVTTASPFQWSGPNDSIKSCRFCSLNGPNVNHDSDCLWHKLEMAIAATEVSSDTLSILAGSFNNEQAIVAAAIAWRRAVKEYSMISSTAPGNSRVALGQRIQRLERELSTLADDLESVPSERPKT